MMTTKYFNDLSSLLLKARLPVRVLVPYNPVKPPAIPRTIIQNTRHISLAKRLVVKRGPRPFHLKLHADISAINR
jgi:hypothetical protein